MQTVVKKGIQKWIKGLASLPIAELSKSPTEIFHQLLPSGSKRQLQEFMELWESRYEVIDPIEKPHQVPTAPGWYSVTSRYARQYVDYMWQDTMLGSIERSFPDMIDVVVDEWNRIVAEGESDDRDLVPVLVHFTTKSKQRPGKLWIDHLCATTYDKIIFLQPVGERWVLTDCRKSPSVFCIYLPSPGTLPFQRAAMVINSNLEWGCCETPLLLEWIFAAGNLNMLKTVDDCLSHRTGGNGRRIDYKAARQLVRRARGL